MNYIEIPNKGEFAIPSDWDELSPEQVCQIMKLALKLNAGQLDYDSFIVRAFYIVAKVKRNWLSVYREYRLSKDKRRTKMADTYLIAEQLTQFIFRESAEKQKEFYYNTVVNFFPKVMVGKTEFKGPQDFLMDITFGEFRKCIDAMNIFRQSKNEEDLDHFFVLLYRPDRQLLHQSNLAELAGQVAKVPLYIKMAVFLWFTTCVHYITSSEIELSGRKLDFSAMFPKPEGNKKDTGIGWASVLFSIAKEGVFGDADKTDQQQLFDVLLYMYDNHLQAIRLKAKK